MTIFHYEVGADGVAIITWDLPEKSMNVLTFQGIDEINSAIDKVISDENVKGAVITSAKKDFAGGMDLNVIAKMKSDAGDDPANNLYDGIMQFHAFLNKIERAGADPKTNKGGKPIAWAARGTCAGIGTEIALATHKRFMADTKRGKIGLPEIKVGIFPGAGGTTRVTRMMGLMNAAPVLLEGKLFDPKKAKQIGLVDELTSDEELLEKARAWVLNATPQEIVKPWYDKKFKFPGGGPYHPAGAMNFIGANAMVHGNTQGVYPAAKAMLSAIYEGAQVPFERALEIEARYFTQILLDPRSGAMIETLFINKEAIEKGANRPNVPDQSVKKVAVLGAGMMGQGIAFISAKAKIEVILLDRDKASAEGGKAAVESIIDQGVKRGKVTNETKEAMLSLIKPTDDYADLEGCDLVIEAVFEDVGVKAEATQKAEAVIPKDAIFATNTSTLPITELAKASRDATNFIGMHFFSPVHKMPLLEIIKGAETGDIAVAKALDFARQTRKTPIVVNDARFFYANRCIIPYINEGIAMVQEGVAPALIENAAKQLGFPVGPLQLTDETSIDLGVKIAKATKAALGSEYEAIADEVIFKLFELERLGRKSNAGFYEYDEKGKRTGLWAGLSENWPVEDDKYDLKTVQDRLIAIQVLEALRALEEDVLLDIREGDVGAIMGWGFAPWSGGPFHYIDIVGAKTFAETCKKLQSEFGARFAPPKNLLEKAKLDEKFCA